MKFLLISLLVSLIVFVKPENSENHVHQRSYNAYDAWVSSLSTCASDLDCKNDSFCKFPK